MVQGIRLAADGPAGPRKISPLTGPPGLEPGTVRLVVAGLPSRSGQRPGVVSRGESAAAQAMRVYNEALGAAPERLEMSLEANKAIIRRLYERGFNEGDCSVFDELYAADFQHHNKTIHDISSGGAGEKQSMLRFREAIPNVCFRIDQSIAEADRVVVLLTVSGTPVTEFPPIKPGESMEFRAAAIFRLADGKVAEEWFYREPAG